MSGQGFQTVCVYLFVHGQTAPFFIKYVCYPVLTPSWSLPSGVSAGGWAPAAAGLTAQGSSQTYRHIAAAVQSPAGEEAVCQDERSSDLHPGIVQWFSSSLILFPSFHSVWFKSLFIVFVLEYASESCFCVNSVLLFIDFEWNCNNTDNMII